MSKYLIAVLFVFVMVAASADPLSPIRSIVKSNECSINKMEELKPQLQKQLEILQQVSLQLYPR
jgi:hypothetical protein